MHRILFTKNSKKDIKKLDKKVRKSIYGALERIRVRPQKFVKKLVDMPYYRLRVGDYRVILDIDKGDLIILVIKIAHRKVVYKRLFKRTKSRN